MVIGPFKDEYDFLSNFYIVDVCYNGIVFKSSEHAYQSMKATNYTDMMLLANTKTPGLCKRIVKNIEIREDWKDARLYIMKDICRIKFNNEYLKEKLLSTGNSEIVEINNWNDTFWGVCDGVGSNHLGKILMEIRDEIYLKDEIEKVSLYKMYLKIFKKHCDIVGYPSIKFKDKICQSMKK